MSHTLPTAAVLLIFAFACQSYKMILFPLKHTELSQNIFTEPSLSSPQQTTPNQAYNMTGYQFLGLSYLSSTRQLNKTISSFQLQPDIKTVWRVNKTLQFQMKIAKIAYKYNFQGQQTKISPANKEIMVSNASVDVQMEFFWKKNINSSESQSYGWATAITTSSQLSYIYKFVDDPDKQPGYPLANLTEYYPFKLRNFVITDDRNITDEDKPFIFSLLNNADATDSIKELLEAKLADSYSSNLPTSIILTTIGSSSYFGAWVKTIDCRDRQTISLYFKTEACGYNITKEGISYAYRLVNTSVPNFDDPPIEPQRLDPAIYGEQQEFISFSQYRNFIVLAIQKNATASLIGENFTTFDFYFTIGELFDVFSGLDKKFDPKKNVYGYYCNGTDDFSNIKLSQASNSTFYVDMGWKCDFFAYVNEYRLQQFAGVSLTGKLEVAGYPQRKSIDYWVKKFTIASISVDDSFGYKLINKTKAEAIVSSVASKVLDYSKLPGSGWMHAVEFDKPSFLVTKTGTFVTDSSSKPTMTTQ